MSAVTTLNDRRPAAEICRERGWKPGTKIMAPGDAGPTIIEVSALGTHAMLAKAILLNGQPPSYGDERSWRLSDRDWREVRS